MNAFQSLRFPFRGLSGCQSICGVSIHHGEGQVVITLTELPENEGTSVTNYVEQLAALLYSRYLTDIEIVRLRWLTEDINGALSEVRFDVAEPHRFIGPSWTFMLPGRDEKK